MAFPNQFWFSKFFRIGNSITYTVFPDRIAFKQSSPVWNNIEISSKWEQGQIPRNPRIDV